MRILKLISVACLGAGIILAAIPPAYHLAHGNLLFGLTPVEAKTDAVVVFTGDAERISEGYREYLDGDAEKIMVTGDDFPEQAIEPEVKELAKEIRRDDIYVDLEATNTIENAEHVAEWAQWQDIDSLSLVTSQDHMPRAFFELRRILPEHIKIYPRPVEGELKYAGIDSETGRLLCRMYETVSDKPFCYQARELARRIGM